MPRLSDAELSARRTGMGSTDVVEACGLAPWKGSGPMRVYCEKLGIKPPDDAEEIDDEDPRDWGHVMEPVIADWYARRRTVTLIRGAKQPSHDYPWLWATLDRKVTDMPLLVEIKNVGSPPFYRHWNVADQDGIPNYVRAQVTIAMRCTGIYETDIVACIGGRPPHVWTVAYDAELADMLIAGGLRLWNMVEARTPPPLDETPATRAYLDARYPQNVERRMIEASAEAEVWAAERIRATKVRHDAESIEKRATAHLLEAAGDADGIVGNGWRKTWKTDKNGSRRPRFTGSGEE